MTTDLRPPRSAFRTYDVPCIVTPSGGAPYASTCARVAPSASAPNIEAESVVTDTRKRFSFWEAEAPGLTPGDAFEITGGPDAGAYRISEADHVDGEVVEVIVL